MKWWTIRKHDLTKKFRHIYVDDIEASPNYDHSTIDVQGEDAEAATGSTQLTAYIGIGKSYYGSVSVSFYANSKYQKHISK